MKKPSNPGQSPERTLGKHLVLNAVVGKLTGAFTTPPCRAFLDPPFVYIDLCAGDGQPSYFSGWSSPEILQKHANWLRKRLKNPKAAVVILIERDPATFSRLEQSPWAENAHLICGDSKDPSVIAQIKEIIDSVATPSSPCFVHSDPNKVTDWPITEDLLEILPINTCLLATMGCNVGGVKRLGLEEREKWFDFVKPIAKRVESIPRHDALVVSLNGDCAQWAYLLVVPRVWRTEVTIAFKDAFKQWKKGIELAWLSAPLVFKSLIKKLFLTKKELDADVA